MTLQTSVFVTNNGLSDHIGLAQVLPYLEGLSRSGHKIVCLSVERPDKAQTYHDEVAPRLARAGIRHHPVLRHGSVLASRLERFFMPATLSSHLDRIVQRYKASLIHCRSYMPLASALTASRKHHVPMLFDMRGFWIDERIESGIWSGALGQVYARHFRKLEANAYGQADGIVTLSQDARSVVLGDPAYRGAPISVIPCSVDQSLFQPDRVLGGRIREVLGIDPDELVLVHSGSAGPLYKMEAAYQLVKALEAKGARVRLLLLGDHDPDTHLARAQAAEAPLAKQQIICLKVAHHEMPGLLNVADIGLSFRLQSRSSFGVSATKLGEYQAIGLPVISNDGIGDIRQILAQEGLGLVLTDLGPKSIDAAAGKILTQKFSAPEAIRAAGQMRYDMDRAVLSYDAMYRRIGDSRRAVA
ncbi:glycosyltransferase [Aliiroseovarius marinus]|uniref:glycosyltransferase n=1 Tax=Aliiroseovarius marinus TaxID=2500159 RepID=UPI003D7E60FF